jgi:hypothetical protein
MVELSGQSDAEVRASVGDPSCRRCQSRSEFGDIGSKAFINDLGIAIGQDRIAQQPRELFELLIELGAFGGGAGGDHVLLNRPVDVIAVCAHRPTSTTSAGSN